MNKMLCLAADLRRVAYWIHGGNLDLARHTLQLAGKKYAELPPKIACYDDIWQEINMISDMRGGRLQAAERACTASVILQNEATRDTD